MEDDEIDLFLGFEQANTALICKNLTKIEDWRTLNLNVFEAFYYKKLLKTDYNIIFSIIAIMAFMVSYSVAVVYTSANLPFLAVTICIYVTVLIYLLFPLIKYF